MDNQNSLITDFDFTMIADYFSGLNRQGPGSDEQTIKALSFIPELASLRHIADIGCGTGAQTSVLASQTKADIIANDFLPEMIEGLRKRAGRNGFLQRLQTIQCSMDELPFDSHSLDLIWAEGSIYNIGFERGLTLWKPFLRESGYIGVSDACWLTRKRPDQIDWFKEDFPEISDISAKLRIIEKLGYQAMAHFILPQDCWTENYYAPMLSYMDTFLDRHHRSPTAIAFIDRMEEEIEMYRKYGNLYGYVFFIMRKV
ncbi:MAG: class I SAM-dependent methyltransferase [Mediterranea sp.]|jgi:SAM-dependent methyltransferase|nr:class I SAM-dependent methyltransferase [Mediterranea sp.]